MNRFDDFRPDLGRLLAEQEQVAPPHDATARSGGGLPFWWPVAALGRLYAGGALARLGLYRRLVHANLLLGWFDEFREYWERELGNRPINPHEFHFLHGIYRQRANAVSPRPAGSSGDEPAAGQGWQGPLAIYQVFHHQYRLALNPFGIRRYAPFVPSGAHVCEYGCGIAPLASGLIRFYRHRNVRITCVDLPSLMLHFVRWKFRGFPFVKTVAICPQAPTLLEGRFDVVFCLQVLKYVPDPLAVIAALDAALRPGGHFIFDYVPGGAATRDPSARMDALRYVSEHFDTVRGSLPLDGRAVNEVVVRKRG